MQAIQVKYLGSSSRLKATASAGSVTVGYPHEMGQGEPAFRVAAEALLQKLGWDDPAYGRLVGGQLKDGSYVFVFVGSQANPARARCAAPRKRATTKARRNPFVDSRQVQGMRVYAVERDGRVIGWTTGYDRGYARGVAKKFGAKLGRQITSKREIAALQFTDRIDGNQYRPR